MTLKYNSLPRKTLAEPLTASATSFRLNNIKKWDDNNLAAADFGTEAYGAIRDAKGTVVEFFAFDPATIADADIDFTYRGLAYNGTDLTTEVTANQLTWGKGSIVELGTHGPQIFQWLQELIEGIAISGSPDATLTQKGIVEIATTAEIDAETPTGSTGAKLALSPEEFGNSKWALDTVTISSGAGDSGKVPKLNASGKLPEGFISQKVRTTEYTTNDTWTKPDGLIYVEVIAVGGGGGGGGGESASGGGSSGAGGGGGGGGATVVRKIYAPALSATEAITVGGGGAGAAAFTYGDTPTVGVTGTPTTFGSHISAAGGVGGNHPGKGIGGGGGVGSYVIANNTTVNSINGGAGFSRTGGHPLSSPGGKGGNSLLGEGGNGSSSNASAGSVGVRGGGGGGGFGPSSGGNPATAGGLGGAGIVIVHEYF